MRHPFGRGRPASGMSRSADKEQAHVRQCIDMVAYLRYTKIAQATKKRYLQAADRQPHER